MNDTTMWWVLAGTLVALELATGTFYLLMLGLGAVAGALAAMAGYNNSTQLVAAALVGGAGFVGNDVGARRHAGIAGTEGVAGRGGGDVGAMAVGVGGVAQAGIADGEVPEADELVVAGRGRAGAMALVAAQRVREPGAGEGHVAAVDARVDHAHLDTGAVGASGGGFRRLHAGDAPRRGLRRGIARHVSFDVFDVGVVAQTLQRCRRFEVHSQRSGEHNRAEVARLWDAPVGSAEMVGASLLTTLSLLGVLEHLFLALPFRDGMLWGWAFPQRKAAAQINQD